MVAPVEVRVPPVAYGGIELVVSILTEELVRRGHDVTLFASGDSITSARLVSVVPEHLKKKKQDSNFYTTLNLIKCLENSEEFDIIHNHSSTLGLIATSLVKTPVLHTMHIMMDGEMQFAFKNYKGWYNVISKSSIPLVPGGDHFSGVIYNSIDCSKYPFNYGYRGNYLLFFSRFSPEKGAHHAIHASRILGIPVILAGSVTDRNYFKTKVLPYVDNKMIRCETEVTPERKKELMLNAKCLLAPLEWPEIFGLFLAEALACGTPVIAYNQGAAPEIIDDGNTGFVVNTFEEMLSAVKRIDKIDSRECRQQMLDKFDVPRLADNYLQAYRNIISKTLDTAAEVVVKN